MNENKKKNYNWIMAAPNGGFIAAIIIFILFAPFLFGSIFAKDYLAVIIFGIIIAVDLFLAIKFCLIFVVETDNEVITKGLFGTISKLDKKSIKVRLIMQGGGSSGYSEYYILEDHSHKCTCKTFFRNKKEGAIIINKRKTANSFIKGFYKSEVINDSK